jgi:MFS family permease
MFPKFSFEEISNYFLKTESNQFFVSVAIRYLALGMVAIFEPVYLYLYFGRSVSYVLLFWAAFSGIVALTVVFGGRIMARIGLKRTMLLSNLFFFGYYICLFFIKDFFLLAALAIILRAIAATLFWPAFHTDFIRFSKTHRRAEGVGKMSAICLTAGILSPIIGGIILTGLGYAALFTVVLITLFASTFPLFLSKERHEIYTDSYSQAWKRIWKNKEVSLSLVSLGIEGGVDIFMWPIFIFTLGVSYQEMGGISTFALLISALFAFYMGKITARKNHFKLLNIGSVFLAISWVVKYFVVNAFSALLAQNFYRMAKTSALIPFRTILYNKAAAKKGQADEFIIYREIVLNLSRFFFFMFLAGIFFIVDKINLSFIIAAIASTGFSFLAKPRLFSFKTKKAKT